MQIHPVVIWVNLQFALPFTFRSFKSAIEFLKRSKIQFGSFFSLFIYVDPSSTCSCHSSCLFYFSTFFYFCIKEKDNFGRTQNWVMTTTTMILNEKPQTLLSMSSFFIVKRLINNDQVQESIESCLKKKKNHVLF
jgi:hypothetical protein